MTGSAQRQTTVPQDVLERFSSFGREGSTYTVMFHARIAEQMGLSGTDHKCLDLAMRSPEPLTAGQIAERSGLSTGAVTGVIDRLERAGFVRRVRDPHDRRKVLVEVAKFDEKKYAHLFEGLVTNLERVLSQFTPEEWDVIARYNEQILEFMRALVEQPANPA
ncbi:MarR family transcriptional regulator [Solihabitans fulvus]|uniref:MarR family transcriptional regulator n=1 Tax=Solihabitans fulvus TaxID=1892852 RepID=A0A5B2XI84_9PSEU|nr:MarR family transcriptional regulator [Solihabitans fulvus]KAA2262946.1 MarR family transcriptional regulator [Solihabitans fulvus]